MIEEQEIVRVAKARSAEMIASAEAKSKELRRVASSYVDDIMRQAEESMTAAGTLLITWLITEPSAVQCLRRRPNLRRESAPKRNKNT